MKYLILGTLILGGCALMSKSSDLDNLHKVDNKIYRGAQPSANGLKTLRDKYKVRTIINLRETQTDPQISDLISVHLPMTAYNPSIEDIEDFVAAVKSVDYPIFVHCRHGSDRTGLMIAIYRIKFQNWSKEDAYQEMKDGPYGYHDQIWNRTDELLESLNEDWIRNL